MSRLRDVWRLLNSSCLDMNRLTSESLDHDIGRPERAALRAHLVYCPGCRRYARQITLLRTALRRFADRLESDHCLPGPALPDDVRERIKQSLKDR
jgi:predicted anti-sigma-YlaC factor YlaD